MSITTTEYGSTLPATEKQAKRYFENGGEVIVSVDGTPTVGPSTNVNDIGSTTWADLTATVASYGDPRQRYYIVTRPEPADLHAERMADESSPEHAAAYGEPDDADLPHLWAASIEYGGEFSDAEPSVFLALTEHVAKAHAARDMHAFLTACSADCLPDDLPEFKASHDAPPYTDPDALDVWLAEYREATTVPWLEVNQRPIEAALPTH